MVKNNECGNRRVDGYSFLISSTTEWVVLGP